MHLASIERFGLGSLSVWHGAALTIAKWKSSRSPKLFHEALHVGKWSVVLQCPTPFIGEQGTNETVGIVARLTLDEQGNCLMP